MLLENNDLGSMNGLILVFTLIFFVGLISTYVVIIYFLVHPKRKKLIRTHLTMLRESNQNHSINYHYMEDDIILLVNQD